MQPIRVNPFWFMGALAQLKRRGTARRSLGPLEFCKTIYPLLTNIQSTVKIGFMDDITLAGDIRTDEADVNTIINHDADTGLKLNISKYEIIAENPATIPDSSILSKFVKITKDEMTMLGALVFKGPAQDAAIIYKTDHLKGLWDVCCLMLWSY